ncbi:hypothetical protein BH23ACT10_BH23ACT10_17180 [soil metagenome]
MTFNDHDRLLPEQRARVRIDAMLEAAGWVVQDYKAVNLHTGVVVRELVTDAGPADLGDTRRSVLRPARPARSQRRGFVLLERTRAERAAAAQTRRTRKAKTS